MIVSLASIGGQTIRCGVCIKSIRDFSDSFKEGTGRLTAILIRREEGGGCCFYIIAGLKERGICLTTVPDWFSAWGKTFSALTNFVFIDSATILSESVAVW
jgi:hypothetical protein